MDARERVFSHFSVVSFLRVTLTHSMRERRIDDFRIMFQIYVMNNRQYRMIVIIC